IPGAIPSGLDIKSVVNAAQVEHFADVLAAAAPGGEHIKTFYTDSKEAIIAPASPLRLYIGYVNNEPAAVLEAFSAHGILNFYTMSSPAAYRGKGYAAGLMLAALRDAKKAGLRLASLQTPESGRAAYERIGFKPA